MLVTAHHSLCSYKKTTNFTIWSYIITTETFNKQILSHSITDAELKKVFFFNFSVFVFLFAS